MMTMTMWRHQGIVAIIGLVVAVCERFIHVFVKILDKFFLDDGPVPPHLQLDFPERSLLSPHVRFSRGLSLQSACGLTICV